MKRKFNDTGLCVPHRHYMADTSAKIEQIIELVEAGEYFTINRPRQFGKTTTLHLLNTQLSLREDYLTLAISFEGTGDAPFVSEQAFCQAFLRIIARTVRLGSPEISDDFARASRQVHNFEELSEFISQYVSERDKQVVLLVDEVDKSSNSHIFLHFLEMLRNKYLLRNMGQDHTFHSVVLVGVHDIKTLKAKIRPDDQRQSFDSAQDKYNSPWNIAADFEVDLSFAPREIETMLQDYIPSERGRCRIHNRIFEQRIYAHIMCELLQTKYLDLNGFSGPEFYTPEGLDVRLILQRFQAFMRENYSDRDAKFLEREGHLLFLSYLRPIINGMGFDFKEPNVSLERRMDIVITWQNRRYVLELKIWHGPKYHQDGLRQLSDYLNIYSLKEGYLLIYDFNKNKEYRQEQIAFGDKQIFAIWV